MSDVKKASKFMSRVLRHRPGDVDVVPDAQGWVRIADLIVGSNGWLTREIIDQVVAENDKQRFAVSEDGLRIRASQGHSFPVDLGLVPVEPPEFLYHGTNKAAYDNFICQEGLKRMSRHHVHMAEVVATAVTVGMRQGSVIVLRIAAKHMHQSGFEFYKSDNGVWLTDHVPLDFMKTVPPARDLMMSHTDPQFPGLLECLMVPSEAWKTCGIPPEGLAVCEEGHDQGIPSGISHHPTMGWFVIMAGQGPMIAWSEQFPDLNPS